jgi:hypothetical protein
MRSYPGSDFPPLGPDWLLAPDERGADFFPAFARISVALQQTLRAEVPPMFFANLENFRDTKKAYPMLLYQASRPFRARMRTELTYDVLNPATLARVFRSAKQCLPELLASTETRLTDAGLAGIARLYQPRRTSDIVDAVQRLSKSRRSLYVLIRTESVLMNALIDLAGFGALRPKEQLKRKVLFEKRWTFELRRIYPGIDCLGIAAPLLESTTKALAEFLSKPERSEDSQSSDSPDPSESDYST